MSPALSRRIVVAPFIRMTDSSGASSGSSLYALLLQELRIVTVSSPRARCGLIKNS